MSILISREACQEVLKVLRVQTYILRYTMQGLQTGRSLAGESPQHHEQLLLAASWGHGAVRVLTTEHLALLSATLDRPVCAVAPADTPGQPHEDQVVTMICNHAPWPCSLSMITPLPGWLHRLTAEEMHQCAMQEACVSPPNKVKSTGKCEVMYVIKSMRGLKHTFLLALSITVSSKNALPLHSSRRAPSFKDASDLAIG